MPRSMKRGTRRVLGLIVYGLGLMLAAPFAFLSLPGVILIELSIWVEGRQNVRGPLNYFGVRRRV